MDILNMTPQEQDVGSLIIDYLLDNDPSGEMEFKPIDIYNHGGKRFEHLWNTRTAQETIGQKFKTLKSYGELEQQYNYYPYRLNQQSSLFKMLSVIRTSRG